MSLVFERGVFLSHKGLNKEIIIKAAADLIETQGRECFSMRLLADSLQVKTASLYNHIKSMDELITSVCEYPSLGFSTITFGSNKIPLLL